MEGQAKRQKTGEATVIAGDKGDKTSENIEDSKISPSDEDSGKAATNFKEAQVRLELAEKKDQYNKKAVRKWERRWVLQPNVIEYGQDIWIQKWICVDNINPINLGEPSKQFYEKVNGNYQQPNIDQAAFKENEEKGF